MAVHKSKDRTRRMAALAGIRRLCFADLDSVALREALAEQLRRAVPFDAWAFSLLDPEVGLMTHTVEEGIPEPLGSVFVQDIYPNGEAQLLLDLFRRGELVTTEVTERQRQAMIESGVGDDMRVVFSTGRTPWGAACMMRDSGSRAYSNDDLDFMRGITREVAVALRKAMLREEAAASAAAAAALPDGPGIVGVDRAGNICLQDTRGASYMDDISDGGKPQGRAPQAVISAVTLLRWQLERLGDPARSPRESCVRCPGRSGRWYSLYAACREPDSTDSHRWLVVISPVTPLERASLLITLYGLTAREREVIARVTRGETTHLISQALTLSPHTVQDHIDSACDKLGVGGRKALIARLYFDLTGT